MSEKIKDKKGRWRNKIVAFRMSPEEALELDDRVRLCGARTKQDYLVESALYQRVVAKGNPMMLVTFRDELHAILHELRRIQDASEMDEELLTPIRTMLEILEAFKVNEETKGKNEKKQFMERRQYRNV